MNAAHQNNWIEAQQTLKKGLQRYKNTTFIYKKPMTMAYLALAYSFTNNHIQAQSMAQDVMDNSKSNKQARTIKNADDEISAGTVISMAFNDCPPCMVTFKLLEVNFTPKPRSIFSV